MTKHRKGPATPQLSAEYCAGATTVELGEKHGMSPTAVNGRLRRAGIAIRPARKRCVADSSISEIASAYQNGVSVTDIVTRYGGSRSSIVRGLKEFGVTMHPHGLRTRTVRIPVNPIFMGYLCGLFDGEGNLQIRAKHDGKSVACRMQIYSTTPAIMQWLTKHVGGTSRFDTKRTERKGWLPIGVWSLYRAQDVAALLKAMLPHLIIKKAVTEHALTIFGSRFKIHDSPPAMIQ